MNAKIFMGRQLIEAGVIDEKALNAALARQRLHGGRIGQNLVALGYMSEQQLERFFDHRPPTPLSLEETGLELTFVADLALKHTLFAGEFRLQDLSHSMKLPMAVLDEAIELLRREKLLEVKSASQFVKSSYTFHITDLGKVRAAELLEICRYTGPAPVVLEDYRTMVRQQAIRNIIVDEKTVRAAFSEYVIGEKLLKRLGPAISSGQPIFVYGPPGNGKTTIAETIGGVLPDKVYVPHALLVGGQIIKVYDPVTHVFIPNGEGEMDMRWVKVRRPVIITGGELTLRMLDLEFNRISKFYEAPLQMKANNGLFIVDDFGRQQMDPQNLLNRWIVNLDRRIDYLSLHTGMKFEVPFDELVIFSTNIEPKDLVDEAFLRRIRYKIKVDYPTLEEYETIFRKVCDTKGVEFNKKIFNHLIEHHYRHRGLPLNACHPRDLIEHIIDSSRYYNRSAVLSFEAIDTACENYFVDM